MAKLRRLMWFLEFNTIHIIMLSQKWNCFGSRIGEGLKRK